MFVCIQAPGIAVSGVAAGFSPRVEEVDADTVILDASGLTRLLGSPEAIAKRIREQTGEDARIAVAASREAALSAARGFAGITILPPGEEAERLGDLPLELLSPPPEILETFDRWGIRRFRDLASLPEVGLAERLGDEGLRLQRLARGQSNGPLRPAEASTVYEQSMDLEYPVELLEPLSFLLSRLLNDLCGQLAGDAMAAIGLRLTLKLENRREHNRTLRLPVPMRNPLTFLKLLQLDLTAHPPPAPIVALTLAADPARPRTVQEGLFLPSSPEAEKLELTLARIAGLVGAENVGSPELTDTHRPGAFRMGKPLPQRSPRQRPAASANRPDSRLAFRMFRPPLPASVPVHGGQPVEISAQQVRGRIAACAGPWRTSGDWWKPEAWARDDWDIALSDGALYRVYQVQSTGRWFVEGRYD